ncbi:hypothetical protein NA56DRAFT_65113 [Hyaloscypha hepaticicola]|uniref:2EXR domain-containing protein n=1 Tax=Hyaloscypha hepaticicola TaxID=2082293 RepID=A0A2J6QAF6_9HELO|nr:hypothetical protein NA56DRAFT_65113 [Hyaloscypha hepaticicola]
MATSSASPANTTNDNRVDFRRLPPEVRLMIWNLTTEPRVIELIHIPWNGFTTKTPPPVALAICQESRNEVIRRYPKCFGTYYNPSNIRFNWEIDILYLGPEAVENAAAALLDRMHEKDYLSLRNVAFHESAFVSNESWAPMAVRALKMMKNVEREIVVAEQRVWGLIRACGQGLKSKEHLRLGRITLCFRSSDMTAEEEVELFFLIQRQRAQWRVLPVREIEMMFGVRGAGRNSSWN